MNPATVVIGGVGVLLIYCAVKGKDPRSVISDALGKPTSAKKLAGAADTTDTGNTSDSADTAVTRVGN